MLIPARWEALLVTLVLRTVLIYFFVLVILRLMGKREIGQLSPFDFVVAIIIAELATIPIESPRTPLWLGLVPITVLAVLEIGFSYLALHSRRLRRLFYGIPQVVVAHGKLVPEEMRRARYNLDDVTAQLREKGYPDLTQVEFAILETSGELSVIPREGARRDHGGPCLAGHDGLPRVLVMDGEVERENLTAAGRDEAWLAAELAARGLAVRDVFIAMLARDGSLFVQPRREKRQDFVK
ncbi:MAG TPA: hypothetical protein DCL13_04205 [Peptococcaceae bacterium]|nr:hypothetical protein [Peptococcaceae bacterium]